MLKRRKTIFTTSNRLIIFTKYPVPGRVKTRLVPVLGSDASAKLHRILTELTINKAVSAKKSSDFDIETHFCESPHRLMRQWLGPSFRYRRQIEGDLGEKMLYAFKCAFDEGCKKVVLIGTDIPGLTPHILAQAFQDLDDHDAVIGPATDGGYYLIGTVGFYPALFQNISWGAFDVFDQTIYKLSSLSLKTKMAPELSDLDRPSDLFKLEVYSLFGNMCFDENNFRDHTDSE